LKKTSSLFPLFLESFIKESLNKREGGIMVSYFSEKMYGHGKSSEEISVHTFIFGNLKVS